MQKNYKNSKNQQKGKKAKYEADVITISVALLFHCRKAILFYVYFWGEI